MTQRELFDRFSDEPISEEEQAAVDEFIATAKEFLLLLNSTQIIKPKVDDATKHQLRSDD